jgi:hypothetical protein
MDEEEQTNQVSKGIKLPIDWHVPDTLQSRYVHNVAVQPGAHEFTLFFFETQIPPFVGTAEENKEYLQKKGSIRFECVSKIIVAPQLMPEIIKALQAGLDNYNAVNELGERAAKNESDQ